MVAERQDDEREGTGFRVKDKRRFNPDGSPRADAPAEETTEPAARSDAEAAGRAQAPPESATEPPRPSSWAAGAGDALPDPPADFVSLILSLAQSAMIDLGAAPHPETGTFQPDLRLARQTIDTVAMLQEKTRNNLDEDEARLLEGVLYQLRLAFVEARKRAQQPKPPT